jgi:hydantoinase/carbamoylase family amidase
VPELLNQLDASRLTRDLADLATFSAPGPGVTRLAWTPEHIQACRWLAYRMEQEGLEATLDPAGNVVGKLNPEGRGGAIVVGSHIDTVRHGGRFDGVLGVVAGLAIVSALREERSTLDRPVWVVAFMDEEGVRFGTSLFGSRAFAGEALPGLDSVDADGVTLAEAIQTAGLDPEAAESASQIVDVSAYLELHIEQGPILEDAGNKIGVVTDVVGRSVFSVNVDGEANHAGTTPPERRRDALLGASDLVVHVNESFSRLKGASVNVGQLKVEPGSVNVVPGAAHLEVEIRAPSLTALLGAEKLLRDCSKAVEGRRPLGIRVHRRDHVEPTSFDPGLVDLLDRMATGGGRPTMRIVSGAGHDAMVMAGHVPTAMLMVPSKAGVSHSPAEFTSPALCQSGTESLAAAVRELASDSRRDP